MLSISYLLATVQLTWQVDNGQFLMIIFHKIHQYWACVYEGLGRRSMGVGWVVGKAKAKKQDDTIVQFRVAMMFTCNHKEQIFHYKA